MYCHQTLEEISAHQYHQSLRRLLQNAKVKASEYKLAYIKEKSCMYCPWTGAHIYNTC